MAQPTQLSPTEQDALVKQIGLAMLRVAPDDWVQLTVDYRAVGRYSETTGQAVFSNGGSESWTMPQDLQGLFARLRGGMYREGRGTWFNARYRLDHPSSYNLEYDREEPTWDLPPPPMAYPDELRMFPRTDDNVPSWMRRRLASTPPPPGRFRVARIFDGPGSAVNRPPVSPEDVRDLLGYLDGAPLAGPARGYDVDRMDPDGRKSVPVAFHTDGTWIWPAAVNYYLREHDVPPEPGLVNHIARKRFELPPVDDSVRSAAAAFLGGGQGGPGPGRPAGPPPRPPAPGPTQAMPMPGPRGPRPGGPPSGPLTPPPPSPPTQVVPAPAPMVVPEPARSAPSAALPSQGPPGRTVDALRSRLSELGVPESAFRIGPPAARAWTMEQTDEGWRVGWYDRAFVAPAMFEDVADASAFLLGKLMMDVDGGRAAPIPELGRPTENLAGRPPTAAMPAPDFAPPAAVPGGLPGMGPGPANADYAQPDGGYGAPDLGAGFGGPGGGALEDGFGPALSSPNGVLGAPGSFGPGSDAPAAATEQPVYDLSGAGLPDPEPESGRHGRHADASHNGQPDNGRSTFAQSNAPAYQPDGYGQPEQALGLSNGGFDPPDAPFGGQPAHPDPQSPALPDTGFERTQFARADALTNSPHSGFDRPDLAPPDSGFGADVPRPGSLRPSLDQPDLARPDSPRGGDNATTFVKPPSARPAAAPVSGDWPISPLPGEPPLTLFRGKRLVELEPGTEIDRFGDDDGNLVYDIGTPFTERSLVPEWVDRPYRTYRIMRPVQVLTGIAIPWFDQPGGGTAYLLPDAIGELVALGRLVELNDRERPAG